jgi:hypothetical protein
LEPHHPGAHHLTGGMVSEERKRFSMWGSSKAIGPDFLELAG